MEKPKKKRLGNIVLGDEYIDSILGFKGVATSLCVYLEGEDRVELSCVTDGQVNTHWVETNFVEKV